MTEPLYVPKDEKEEAKVSLVTGRTRFAANALREHFQTEADAKEAILIDADEPDEYDCCAQTVLDAAEHWDNHNA